MRNNASRGSGTANQIGGRIQRGIGRAVGNTEMEARGAGREAAGTVEKETAKAQQRGRGKAEELSGKAREVGGRIRQKLNK